MVLASSSLLASVRFMLFQSFLWLYIWEEFTQTTCPICGPCDVAKVYVGAAPDKYVEDDKSPVLVDHNDELVQDWGVAAEVVGG